MGSEHLALKRRTKKLTFMQKKESGEIWILGRGKK